MSFGLGLSASSWNPTLAWSMGSGGKGRILIRFPMALDNGWYREQACTTFQTFEHRKERKGFKHEFIVLRLLDGSVCRIERMGDPDARFDAISPRGSVAHDMAQCFGPDELEQACLDTSDTVSTISLPFGCDIMDVLKICRAICEGEKTRNYTLQVYNCYFFSLAIQACLTRLIARWEDEVILRAWLSQIGQSAAGLPDALQSRMELPSSQFTILKLCSTLFSNPGCMDLASLVNDISTGVQVRLTRDPGSAYRDISNRINDILWHSAISSGLNRFVEDKIKDVVGEIIENSIDQLLGISNAHTDQNTNTLKIELTSVFAYLLVSSSTSLNTDNPSKRCSPKSKNVRAKPLQASVHSTTSISQLDFKGNPTKPEEERENSLADWCQWISKHLPYLILWLLCTTLGLWGATIWILETNFTPLASIEDELGQALARLKSLKRTTCSDLEPFVNDLRTLINNKAAIWYRNPWADNCDCITQCLPFDIIAERQHETEDLSISAFQRHIVGRIKLQAKEVQSAWLGSAPTIETELKEMLSEVWKMIREDDEFDITKGRERELQSESIYHMATAKQQKAQQKNTGAEERGGHRSGSGKETNNSGDLTHAHESENANRIPAEDLAWSIETSEDPKLTQIALQAVTGADPNNSNQHQGLLKQSVPMNGSIQPASEIDSMHRSEFPDVNIYEPTSEHKRGAPSSPSANTSSIPHPVVDVSEKTNSNHEQQYAGLGINPTRATIPTESLGEIHPKSPDPPDISKEIPKIQYKSRSMSNLPDSAPRGLSNAANTTTNVRLMMAMIERAEKEKKEKRNERGFFNKIFKK